MLTVMYQKKYHIIQTTISSSTDGSCFHSVSQSAEVTSTSQSVSGGLSTDLTSSARSTSTTHPPPGGGVSSLSGGATMQAYQNPMGMQNAGFYAQSQNPYGVLPQSYSSMSDGKPCYCFVLLISRSIMI